MVERLKASQLGGLGSEEEIEQFIESDYRIRTGQCPNGCGLMTEANDGQQCENCGFWTNTYAERVTEH